ncbi:glycosyltransferase [Chryseobacterium sp. MFBS3-17]|uniref:glycosyltransferase n=1 Tax=Chryseobacterium sp. MFBS3-17 TaxID=2886689 RepID=UPI001D0EEC66|nr:glycosyltransferase family 2 protein [Chryseobacterium sp. MFBS3-17]MCC2591387.1 glycosyltransferase family 2 protein [Chryseobacterium sp. MFBS3-17]
MISASIVLYKNNIEILNDTIKSIEKSINANDIYIFLIDNSPTDRLKEINLHNKMDYFHNPSNPGFGSGHNIAIRRSMELDCQYHFVINPDVCFNSNVIKQMIRYMEEHHDVGMLMPKIVNNDGSVQNLPKLLPSPYALLMRKLRRPAFLYNNFIRNYELRFVPQQTTYNAPVLSGCFTLLRNSALKEVGFYDERFFMYFEDWDLSRRMHMKYKTIYYPLVSVIHGYESGANKNKRLFVIFVKSAIAYFNKWGWICDQGRRRINRKTLNQFS